MTGNCFIWIKRTGPSSSQFYRWFSDKFTVDAIFDLINIVVKLSLFGGAIFIALSYMRSKKLNSFKTDIQNLQARLSQLRLALRAKVKRKSNVLRAASNVAVVEGDMFDSALKQLVENKFESSDDFQEYFDISRKLVKTIQIESKELISEVSIENNYMSQDFKTEMDIVRMIKEMCDLSAKINARIEEQKRTSPGQKIARVDSLVFPAITEVNRIFNSEDKGESHSSDERNKAS